MEKMTDEELLKTVREYEKCKNNAALAGRNMGVQRKTISNRIKRAMERGLMGPIGHISRPSTTQKALNYNDFRSQFDDSLVVPQKIEEGVSKFLLNGGEPVAMKDIDFRDACGVSVSKWRRYAEDFQHLQIRVPGGQLFWAHPDLVDKLREVVSR